MRTKDEMEAYARGLAEQFFYSDDEYTPWEPFENWHNADIEEEVENLAGLLCLAMVWVQEGSLT